MAKNKTLKYSRNRYFHTMQIVYFPILEKVITIKYQKIMGH